MKTDKIIIGNIPSKFGYYYPISENMGGFKVDNVTITNSDMRIIESIPRFKSWKFTNRFDILWIYVTWSKKKK